jgi:hypothetical protein
MNINTKNEEVLSFVVEVQWLLAYLYNTTVCHQQNLKYSGSLTQDKFIFQVQIVIWFLLLLSSFPIPSLECLVWELWENSFNGKLFNKTKTAAFKSSFLNCGKPS